MIPPSLRRALLMAVVWAIAAQAAAYETDQYSGRRQPLADARQALNDRINETLREVAGSWHQGADRKAFARAVYKKLGGRHWVDRLERWAIRNDQIAKAQTSRRQSIYRGLPFWATRVNFFFGVGPTIQVGNTRIGTDKLGHFISQGWKYHKRHLRGLSDDAVVRLGRRNEASIFGSPATGSFSNADLVANYEGYLFFRSLFEDETVPGKRAIIGWRDDGGTEIQRAFDLADHVNDYWDEALNPNRYDRLLRGPMESRLQRLCPDYRAMPSAYVSSHDADLRQRYAELGLRDGSRHRLDSVCANSARD